jgi:hypothetical protein
VTTNNRCVLLAQLQGKAQNQFPDAEGIIIKCTLLCNIFPSIVYHNVSTLITITLNPTLLLSVVAVFLHAQLRSRFEKTVSSETLVTHLGERSTDNRFEHLTTIVYTAETYKKQTKINIDTLASSVNSMLSTVKDLSFSPRIAAEMMDTGLFVTRHRSSNAERMPSTIHNKTQEHEL